ncbi:MAG: hypothetical protein WAM69_00370 [Candidatus Sulfotelmatobacter sp.]
MNKRRLSAATDWLRAIALCAVGAAVIPLAPFCYATPAARQGSQAAAPNAVTRPIGTIKAINGTSITLAPASGPDLNITVQPTTRILRIAPGEKNLKNATPISLQDLQIGDRILVGGKPSGDNLSFVASTIVAMKRSDLEARHEQDLQDWQKRGVGGLVSAVDPAAGTVTISVVGFTGKKDIVIHSSKTTVIRRYAPDSVNFDDAKPSTLADIHPGDQVRARGDRSAEGSELAAEEIVSGSFRNIAGVIDSVDASSSLLTIHDLLSKKTVVVKIAQDSQLRQLPAEMARRIAIRLKGAAAARLGAASGSGSANGEASGRTAEGEMSLGENGMHPRSGGAPDFQQMLNRVPAVTLADLHKGDAVMIVSTQGTAGTGTVVTLVSGVEPIFEAAPNANAAQQAMLGSWSLGAPSGDAGGP